MPTMSTEEFVKHLLLEYEKTVTTLFSEPEQWKNFLSVSCYNYKLRFDQQVLIYSQKPQAAIVATHDQWFKLYRPIGKNQKALYVLDTEYGRNNRYIRYYEQSQTRTLSKSKPVPFWILKKGYKDLVVQALKSEFETFENTDFENKSFEQEIISTAKIIAENEAEAYYDQLFDDIEYTHLEELDENTVFQIFSELVSNSTAYSMLSRLGINADDYIGSTIFDDVMNFNSEATMAVVGKATQQMTQIGLSAIAKAIRQYEREVAQNERIRTDDTRRKDRIQQKLTGRGQAVEPLSDSRLSSRGIAEDVPRQDQRILVSTERGIGNIRSDDRNAEGRGPADRNLSESEKRISGGGEIRNVRENVVQRNSKQTLQRESERVLRDGRETDGEDEENRGDKLRTSEERLVDLRFSPAEPAAESERDSTQRVGLHLNEENSIEKQEAEIDQSTSASFFVDTDTEKTFAQQVDEALSPENENQFNAIKVCDTPNFLIKLGCRQLPMLYTQKHLREAVHPKSKNNSHWHGLTAEQIKRLPDLLENPVIVYDSLTRNDSIIICINETDSEKLPIIVSVKPNGYGTYELERIESNFITSIYGRSNFESHIEEVLNQDKLLYWDRKKSQDLFRVSGLQLPKCLNNLDSNIIIHQSQNIVNQDEALQEKNVSTQSNSNNQLTLFSSEEQEVPLNGRDLLKLDLMHGTGVQDGKFRINDFFKANNPSTAEFAKFLSAEYGIGGRSGNLGELHSSSHDGSGIHLESTNGDELYFNWSTVAKEISYLIVNNSYITQKDIDMRISWAKYTVENTNPSNEYYQNIVNNAKATLSEYGIEAEYEGIIENEPEQIVPKKDTITALFIESDKRPYIKEIKTELAAYQEAVGGDIEVVYPFDDKVGLIVNEEGKLEGLPLNRALYDDNGEIYDVIAGSFLIVGLSEESFKSLSQEQIKKYTDMFLYPQYFFNINGKILAMPNTEFSDELKEISSEIEETETYPSERTANENANTEQHNTDLENGKVSEKTKIDFDLSAHPIEEIGPKARYQRNIEAIRTLSVCRSEQRNAVPEEQITLSKYVGWGGLQEAFDPNKPNWAGEYKELKSLLSEDEYQAASESTLTAFYTPPTVISAIYTALESFGFKKGNILEPSCGVGSFIGMLPQTMQDSRVYGVELDPVSAQIAQQLYQSRSILNCGFENSNYPDNFFDVAVGNVPFGDIKINDKRYNKNNFLIHDYFFAKAIDQVRAGGIVAFITSKGTLDKANPKFRRYLAQRAELIGAIRLPDDTFKGNAGTRVTSDIIFLQKRDRMVEIEPDWVHLDLNENGISMNSYFVQNPDMILGEMVKESGPFGETTACKHMDGTELESMLDRAVQNLSAVITENNSYEINDPENDYSESIPADPTVKDNSYTLIGGDIYYREQSLMYKRDFANEKGGESKAERIRAILPIRDCLRKLIDLQMDNADDVTLTAEQDKLNTVYDSFVLKYGRLNDRKNKGAIQADISSSLLFSLENFDENGKFSGKADIFSKRTISPHIVITKVDSSEEALAVSLGEKASVDMEYMSKLSEKSESELYSELAGAIFINPEYNEYTGENGTQKYLARDEYLSGNVREKLKLAAYMQSKLNDERLSLNITELEKVIPKSLTPAEIAAPLGATWIPEEDIEEFVFQTLNIPYYLQSRITVRYSQLTGEWKIEGKSLHNNYLVNDVFGTQRKNAFYLIEDCLNLRNTKVFDAKDGPDGKTKYVINEVESQLASDKQEDIRNAFDCWIWQNSERRQRLVDLYNTKFNSIVPRQYDGSHLIFAGMSPDIKLKQHQLNAVARAVYGGNTLLAHCVGAGKTFEMIAIAQESKRLGLCSKSLFVVPKHLLRQWANEYMRLYPAANILVSTPKDFTRDGRRKFTARIATGDYDAVLITQPQFDKIQLTPEYQKMIINEEIERVAEARLGADVKTVKELNKVIKKLKTKYEELSNSESKDDVIYFEELGIDRIFVDESHAYKNLYHPTKLKNVSGLANTESKRASGMHMICRYLDEKTNGKGVIFATGTPLANSMSEVYTIMYNLQYSLLSQIGMTSFDSWVSTFAKPVTDFELAVDGNSYVEKTRFSEFRNIPELKRMVFEVMDIQTAESLKLPVPTAKKETILLNASPEQQLIVKSFGKRAENYRMKKGNYSPAEMLLITSDARKVSLDQQVYDSSLPDNDYNKSTICAKKAAEIYTRFNSAKATQMIFCDMSTPGGTNSKEFCIYDSLKEKLIAFGIPKEEIAFIHDADTDEKKDKLFKEMREGTKRILIGSTAKMGTGTNVQKRLIALHHLDCPWRPMDLEQQEGRIIRQGNENKEVYIYTYVTEGTFDANMYQTIARKQKAVSQFYSKDMTVRSCEDISDAVLDYLDVAALTTGNELIKEQAQLQKVVNKLTRQRTTFLNLKYTLQDNIEREFPQRIKQLENLLPKIKADLAVVKANPKTENFAGITVKGINYGDRTDGGEALISAASHINNVAYSEIGEYRGFKIEARYLPETKERELALKGEIRYTTTLSKDFVGNIRKLDNTVASVETRLIAAEDRLKEAENELESAKIEAQKEFPHEEELQEKKARIEEIKAAMAVKDQAKTY